MDKKFIRIHILLIVLLLSMALTACGSPAPKGDKLSIVTTSFPQYDWARQVLGERTSQVDLVLLQDSGIDPHSFQPSTKDFVKIANADFFIYGGGPSDSWAAEALKNADNPKLVALNLIEELGPQVKLIGESESREYEGEESEDHALNDGHDHSSEIDEHIWLSLKNAATMTRSISEILCTLDPAHAKEYSQNADNYITELNDLDQKYESTLAEAPQKLVIVADRFPFRYLFNDYDIEFFAAFDGCSSDSEASFDTIISLAQKADENNINKFIVTESSNKKIADALIKNSTLSDHEILVLNALQSVTRDDIAAGMSYVKYMEENLKTLRLVLDVPATQ